MLSPNESGTALLFEDLTAACTTGIDVDAEAKSIALRMVLLSIVQFAAQNKHLRFCAAACKRYIVMFCGMSVFALFAAGYRHVAVEFVEELSPNHNLFNDTMPDTAAPEH